MPLTQYFVFPPGEAIPQMLSDGIGLAGFEADPQTGLLRIPTGAQRCDLVVFQDSTPLPADTVCALAEALDGTAAKLGAGAIYADLERPPGEAAAGLLSALSHRNRRLLVPEAYARDGCEPVVLWQPSDGSFSDDLAAKAEVHAAPVWLEYVPVCLRLRITEAGTSAEHITLRTLTQWLAEAAPVIHTNDDLVCHYASRKTPEGVEALLWDTASDYQQKVRLAQQAGFAGILTLYPEIRALQDLPTQTENPVTFR